MDEKTKKIIYIVCGVTLCACIIWLLIDFKILNFVFGFPSTIQIMIFVLLP